MNKAGAEGYRTTRGLLGDKISSPENLKQTGISDKNQDIEQCGLIHRGQKNHKSSCKEQALFRQECPTNVNTFIFMVPEN